MDSSLRSFRVRMGCILASPILLIAAVVTGGLFFYSPTDDPAKLAEPLPGFPKQPPAIKEPNPWHIGPDLHGRVIVFDEMVVPIIGIDGRFLTGLTANEYAAKLFVEVKTISMPDGRLNPDAVLFRAQSAVLTANGKTQSLEMRKHQMLSEIYRPAKRWLRTPVAI
jgi:hypothetical protein